MVKNLKQQFYKNIILIGSIYRHPTEDSSKFLDDFSDCMEKLVDKKKMFYIIGDINIDINKTNQNSPQADRYIQVITRNGAFSLIVIVITFTKLLPWPGESKRTFRSSIQAASTCLPHTAEASYCPFNC